MRAGEESASARVCSRGAPPLVPSRPAPRRLLEAGRDRRRRLERHGDRVELELRSDVDERIVHRDVKPANVLLVGREHECDDGRELELERRSLRRQPMPANRVVQHPRTVRAVPRPDEVPELLPQQHRARRSVQRVGAASLRLHDESRVRAASVWRVAGDLQLVGDVRNVRSKPVGLLSRHVPRADAASLPGLAGRPALDAPAPADPHAHHKRHLERSTSPGTPSTRPSKPGALEAYCQPAHSFQGFGTIGAGALV